MENWQKAQELLEERVKNHVFNDEIQTMVNDIIHEKIAKIEQELDMGDGDIDKDGVAWYDSIMEDMRDDLYKRIERMASWLIKYGWYKSLRR